MKHTGTTSEHTEIKALPEHSGQARYCSACNWWFYRTYEQVSKMKPIADMTEEEFSVFVVNRAR